MGRRTSIVFVTVVVCLSAYHNGVMGKENYDVNVYEPRQSVGSAGTVLDMTNEGRWDDSYRLEYSYDFLKSTGPQYWSKVVSPDGFWGEWGRVNVATAGLWQPTENMCTDDALRPSPIELIPDEECTDTHEMYVRQINPDMDCDVATTTQFAITPYSLRLYWPRTDADCWRPSLRLDGIEQANRRNLEHFTLAWMELHARSEHVVAGRRYDAELQFVHTTNSRTQELLIVSMLLSADNVYRENAQFQELLDGWQTVADEEAAACQQGTRNLRKGRPTLLDYVSGPTVAFPGEEERHLQRCIPDIYAQGCQDQGMGPRERMFPYNLWPTIWYYSYQGSLTAPPCSDNVHWRVLDQPLSISKRQLKHITLLLKQSRDDSCRFDAVTTLEGENFRPLQKNNPTEQPVAHCSRENFGVTVYDEDEQ